MREELKSLDFKIEASATQDSVDVLQEAVTNLTRQITHLSTLVQQQQAPHNDGRANAHGGQVGFARRVPLKNIEKMMVWESTNFLFQPSLVILKM